MEQPDTGKVDVSLRAAVHRYRAASAAENEHRRRGFERAFLLARLGFGPADLKVFAAAGSAASLPPELREAVLGRLRAEVARLKRLARCGSRRYDLNRHIAVRRALAWADGAVEGRAEQGGGSARSRRQSRRPPRAIVQPAGPFAGSTRLAPG